MKVFQVLKTSLRPGEWGFVALTFSLALAAFLGQDRWAAPDDRLTYGGLFLGYMLVLGLATVWGERPASRALRIAGAVLLSTILYGAMADLAFRWADWSLDPWLERLDTGLFGVFGMDPPWTKVYPKTLIELSSWVYIFFLAYFYLAMIFGFIFRAKEERDTLFSNLVFLYTASYLGYFFLAARGPIEGLGPPPDGGRFHGWVLSMVQKGGGPHGAMPSVHAAAPAYLCIHDLTRGRFSGKLAVIMVLAIGASTLILRYHYVTDFLAGVLIAWSAHKLGSPLAQRWAKKRGKRQVAS